ncbi:alpha/beta fold hydrolase [Commensalibacter nepenthis]|uniref:Alpha/beta hydrolase n=1 Tax=Commensalibacter nepenthis TaxID=3043872 RepID=A0ABT6Q7W1_9PROT|nr:alpha/beta hydrolase [Commensalibacter sp. TBRC 10068]MDI2112991.1 alpha/beta hydrolase [Commensalibacter sp. TBRC 10068]
MEYIHYPVYYNYIELNKVRVFYREAGRKNSPTLLLLHGFPSSSHQFRELIPLLAQHFHIIAPDFPGFGFTEVDSSLDYTYSFDSLSQTLIGFVDALHIDRYIMYVFDYGAPVGLRMVLGQPDRLQGLISQNGNAYIEGLGSAWDPIRLYWEQPTLQNRQNLKDSLLNLTATRWQYTHGVENIEQIAPETYFLDTALFQRAGNKEIQLDLFLDYVNNLKLYPQFQEYFRKYQPKSLIIWGKNDPFFIPDGAHAFKRDNPNAIVELLDSGHFALETHVAHIANAICDMFVE